MATQRRSCCLNVGRGEQSRARLRQSDTSGRKRTVRSIVLASSGQVTSSDGFEGNKQGKAGDTRRLGRVEELASTEIGFRDSDGLKPFHLAVFFIVLSAGLWFLAVLLYFTADIKLQQACLKVVRRLLKTVALRQVMGILSAMMFVRFGLEPLVKALRKLFVAPGSWEKSSEYYILREVRPHLSSYATLLRPYLTLAAAVSVLQA